MRGNYNKKHTRRPATCSEKTCSYMANEGMQTTVRVRLCACAFLHRKQTRVLSRTRSFYDTLHPIRNHPKQPTGESFAHVLVIGKGNAASRLRCARRGFDANKRRAIERSRACSTKIAFPTRTVSTNLDAVLPMRLAIVENIVCVASGERSGCCGGKKKAG